MPAVSVLVKVPGLADEVDGGLPFVLLEFKLTRGSPVLRAGWAMAREDAPAGLLPIARD